MSSRAALNILLLFLPARKYDMFVNEICMCFSECRPACVVATGWEIDYFLKYVKPSFKKHGRKKKTYGPRGTVDIFYLDLNTSKLIIAAYIVRDSLLYADVTN